MLYYLLKYHEELTKWLNTALGKYIIQQTAQTLANNFNKNYFGKNVVIIGEPNFAIITGLEQQIIINSKLNNEESNLFNSIHINARADKIPIDSDSIDSVILVHSLETAINPHEILRESYRILRPEGKMVIIGFNPHSLWGLWKIFAQLWSKIPWRHSFIRITKIIDWLSILGLEEFKIIKYCYNLPVNNNYILNKLAFLNNIGSKLPINLGNLYIICAKKRVISLTPAFSNKWEQEALNDAGKLII